MRLTSRAGRTVLYYAVRRDDWVLKSPDLVPGLCGDFNDVEADDFRSRNGLVQGTSVTFTQSWRTDSNCPPVKTEKPQHPCSMNMKKGRSNTYTHGWWTGTDKNLS